MKILKKQPVAIFVALIIMALALVYGVNRSVSEQVTAVKDQFYNGVFDEQAGFRRAGIHGQLTQRTTAAMRMLAIGDFSHPDVAELQTAGAELQSARNEMIALLTEGATPSALFLADQNLTVATQRYFALLHPLVAAAQGEDLEALEAAEDTMQNAARVISESGYNEAVGVFNRTVMGGFPMTVLRVIVLVQMPELFA
ncbi:MAG: hypothetical protein FWE28_05420 [Oscillospiraceae bacterium]|nr:hypothetical protein [Oscillospiraceae bacterium]